VGNTYWTLDEYQSHFALWAALKAPLLIGCGIIGITSQSLAILGNEEVIAVNQDPLGVQADLMVNEETSSYHRQIWGGPLSDNRYVFVCFNRHPDWTTFRMDFAALLPNKKVIAIREIIEKIDVVVPKDTIFWSKTVKSYASAMYVIEYRTL
jgi:alpha-galactosidase